jgi:streptothricin acetyltransferase
MALILQELDETNLHQLHTVDGSFTVDAKMKLHVQDGEISYTIQPVPAYTKRYALDEIDYATYIRNPDKAAYLAYVDGQPAGQIILRRNWNLYAYIEDIAVDVNYRRQGIGRRLIEQAKTWAKARGLTGIMLETQNNNVASCRLYEACGFHLSGFDQDLYRAIDSNTDESALYWYLSFE